MSYRPYYTNTQIDGQALNGAIAGIGSLFGKGKMTATQGVDPTTGRPTMNYSTTGGDFWDNVMGRQAQKANLAAQGLGFKTDMDLYQNQGTLNQQAKFNSGERLNQAADAETIFRQQGQNTQEGLNSNNPLMRARALEALNKIAELQDQGKLFDTGLNYDKLSSLARIPAAQLAQIQANTQGQLGENQYNLQANPLKISGMELGNQAARQSIEQSGELFPYKKDAAYFDNRLKGQESQWYDPLMQARINDLNEQRAINLRPIPIPHVTGGMFDPRSNKAIQLPLQPLMSTNNAFGTPMVEQQGYRLDPNGKPSYIDAIPQATGLGGYGGTNYGVGYNPAPGTNAPARRISREQLDKLLGK